VQKSEKYLNPKMVFLPKSGCGRMKKITQLERPFICAVITEPDVDSVIKAIDVAEKDGADAFELNLSFLYGSKAGLSTKELKNIFAATERPIFTTNRRVDVKGHVFTGSDEERMQIQLDCFEAGSVGLDMEIDTFAKPGTPLEYIDNSVIKKQREVIRKVHNGGGEVMVSHHEPERIFAPEEAVKIASYIEKVLEADIAKLVSFARSYDDFVACLKTTLSLKKYTKIPFVHQAHGQHAKLSRIICPILGSILFYCPPEVGKGTVIDQPSIRSVKTFLKELSHLIKIYPVEGEESFFMTWKKGQEGKVLVQLKLPYPGRI
jgi:3-dehydroquinate dehydratase type I